MLCFLKNFKIKKELKLFNEFKNDYKFNMKEITKKDECLYCDGELVKKENEAEVPFCDKWLNIGYKFHGPYSKALSNLFRYEFYFRGKKVNSIESVLQGIKYKDKKEQNLVLKYWGMDSNTIKICTDYNWKDKGILFWQGKEIVRDSEEYNKFIVELYVSALQNPLYRNALKNVKTPYILHSLGQEEKAETVLTRYEFEFMLNCLKDYVQRG